METIDRYRRSLKRKNYAAHTVKAYINILAQFTRWLDVPLACVTRNEIGAYVDHLFLKRLSPKTITCHLQTVGLFYDYCINEEGMAMANPVTKIAIRLPKPLPRHLKDDQVASLFAVMSSIVHGLRSTISLSGSLLWSSPPRKSSGATCATSRA